MTNKLRKVNQCKKKVNRMKKRNELKLERGVKDKNQQRNEVPIIAGQSQIMHKGNIPSSRGQEEVTSRSKSLLIKMITKEDLRQPRDQVIQQIIQGKDQELTMNDRPQLPPKLEIKGLNLETSMHKKVKNQNRCRSTLTLLNSCIRKSRQASKIHWQHISYPSRQKGNPKQTQIPILNKKWKRKDQFTRLNSFSALSSKTNRDHQTCLNLTFLTKREDRI